MKTDENGIMVLARKFSLSARDPSAWPRIEVVDVE
jgi:hypothetical protein